MSLRDRLLTKPVAEAIMSPTGIVIGGAGIAAGILAGIPLLAAGGVGVAAYLGSVAFAVPRGPVAERIDRRSVSGPWQQFVDEALSAQKRFATAVDRTRPGPVRDRLDSVGERIDRFVSHSYQAARSGQELTEVRAMIDTSSINADLERLGPLTPGSTTARAAEALQSQLGTADRLDKTIRDTYSRLTLLDARLDELVTRSIELSVAGGDPASLGSVERELTDVVDELEAVRLAVEETG